MDYIHFVILYPSQLCKSHVAGLHSVVFTYAVCDTSPSSEDQDEVNACHHRDAVPSLSPSVDLPRGKWQKRAPVFPLAF